MEKTTFEVSVVHFLLMFGYKIFSLYYPLFLFSIGLSMMNIGGIYLLTYSTIAISSLIINYYIHKFNPAKIAATGIFGYGVFALMMLVSQNLIVFYVAQIILGFSAAAWLVSLKLILMKSKTDNHGRSFGWFYSMPHYATVIAPLVGGAVIWKFGFNGVFLLSVVIQFSTAIYVYFKLGKKCWFHSPDRAVEPVAQKGSTGLSPLRSQHANYKKVSNILKTDKTIFVIFLSIFSALILGGIYRAFFILFLQDLSFSQEEIIRFISIAAIAYLPISIVIIKIIEKFKDLKIASGGIITEGLATMVIGALAPLMNLIGIFFVMMVDSFGSLLVGSGKSSILTGKFKNYKEEASTIDTIMTTLGPALGAFIGGIAISLIGFQFTFLLAGTVVFLTGIIFWFCKKII
ncbi:MAG: MFS transporter [Patescibacteria group bacterium]|nr:MFS transporter [Patescibacteria group bacterium]